jgi:hypothetical protein
MAMVTKQAIQLKADAEYLVSVRPTCDDFFFSAFTGMLATSDPKFSAMPARIATSFAHPSLFAMKITSAMLV